MIPVGTDDIPTSGEELAQRAATALRDALHLPADDVAVTAELAAADAVDRLAVDLTGSVIDSRHLSGSKVTLRPPASTAGGTTTTVRSFAVVGRPVTVFGAPVTFQLDAENVPASWLRDGTGLLWLAFRDEPSAAGTSGRAVVEGEVAALTAAVESAAGELARRKGVTVRDVRVVPRTVGPNRWSVDVAANVKKGFASSDVTARAEVRLDEDLVLHVDELTARAGGIVGALAGGMIEPVLARYRGRAFPLKEQTFAGARVTSVDVELGERFAVTATLG